MKKVKVKWAKRPLLWVKCPCCNKEFAHGTVTVKIKSEKRRKK